MDVSVCDGRWRYVRDGGSAESFSLDLRGGWTRRGTCSQNGQSQSVGELDSRYQVLKLEPLKWRAGWYLVGCWECASVVGVDEGQREL